MNEGEQIFDDLLQYLEDRLSDYCKDAAERANVPIEVILKFRDAAMTAIEDACEDKYGEDAYARLHDEYGSKGPDELQHAACRDARKKLLQLEGDVMLNYCDKHLDQFCLVCRRLYARAAWQYIDDSSDTYRPVADTEKAVAARLADAVANVFNDVQWEDERRNARADTAFWRLSDEHTG